MAGAGDIFVTHPDDCDDDFFAPDATEWNGGENAVIIQPLEKVYNEEYTKGPTIFDENNERFEYIPVLKEGRDPEFITSDKYKRLDNYERYGYDQLIDTDKIGGTPNFFAVMSGLKENGNSFYNFIVISSHLFLI